MILTRRLSTRFLVGWSGPVVLGISSWAALIYVACEVFGLTMLRIPFLPVATIGTAVAFYVGFKNNSAYDRFWEGRKIWGGIVNVSRSYAAGVMAYVHPGDDGAEAAALRRQLVHRHLAWINALRLQLRKTSRFFDRPHRRTADRLQRHGDHMRNDWNLEIAPWLEGDEYSHMTDKVNTATHLLTRQATHLGELQRSGKLDLFHQIALMEHITEMFALQGKCERIKNTPFPRQYAEYSRLFTRVFVVLVPFGLLDVFAEHDHVGAASSALWSALWSGVPMVLSTVIVSWVFFVMEGIGDSSEDPFERSMNDVPMNALCRAIERDLQQVVGDETLSPPEAAVDGILY